MSLVYVLIPGAAGQAWYWHRVEPELRRRGHDVLSVELPAQDDGAGLAEYADAAEAAVGDRDNLVVVAQSMGADVDGQLASKDLRLLDRLRVELPEFLKRGIGLIRCHKWARRKMRVVVLEEIQGKNGCEGNG